MGDNCPTVRVCCGWHNCVSWLMARDTCTNGTRHCWRPELPRATDVETAQHVVGFFVLPVARSQRVVWRCSIGGRPWWLGHGMPRVVPLIRRSRLGLGSNTCFLAPIGDDVEIEGRERIRPNSADSAHVFSSTSDPGRIFQQRSSELPGLPSVRRLQGQIFREALLPSPSECLPARAQAKQSAVHPAPQSVLPTLLRGHHRSTTKAMLCASDSLGVVAPCALLRCFICIAIIWFPNA